MRRALAGAVAWGLLLLSSPCVAQPLAEGSGVEPSLETAVSAEELRQLEAALRSKTPHVRDEALRSLSTLGEDALPAIESHLERLAHRNIDRSLVLGAMTELRTLQGVKAPDADVDLLQGALPLLERDRGEAAVLSVELIALLRALEAQKSWAAAEIIVCKLFSLSSKWFQHEARRTQKRLGVVMIPALIRGRAHVRPWLRAFSEEGLRALHVAEPGRAVQQNDVALLSGILTAFGDTLAFDAMPVVVSYVTDERAEVRDAARGAVARFGKNAIWQLRERYLNLTGKDADAAWGHERVLAEITRFAEAPKQALLNRHLAAAARALEADDYRRAEGELGEALRITPFGPAVARAAPLYARIAGHYEASGELGRALACAQRALRLDPKGAQSAALRARVKFFGAELRLAHGQVDLAAYQQALELDPSLSDARAVLEELTGEAHARERSRRNLLSVFAALLLGVAGLLALRARPHKQPSADAADATEGA